MRVIIFTDSLGRPRPDLQGNDHTEYEDVYGYKLREYFKNKLDIELYYVESLDTQDALMWNQRMVAFRRPDLVIYHLGINDCVPRIFKKNSRSIILNPLFRKLTRDYLMNRIHKHRTLITRWNKITYTSVNDFKKNIEKMMADVRLYSPDVKFMSIAIANAPKQLSERSFGINQNISKYNLILKECFGEGQFVNVNDLLPIDQLIISDNIHLTKKAHNCLAQRLIPHLERIYQQRCEEKRCN